MKLKLDSNIVISAIFTGIGCAYIYNAFLEMIALLLMLPSSNLALERRF